jgi:hypothetical protein
MLRRAALAALFALSIGRGASAQSLCDGPFHWGYCHPPEGQPTAQQTQSDQRGTDANPLVIKEATTGESKSKTQHEAENEAAKASRERQIIWATWVIAIATSLLMIGTGFLARYTSRLWDETKRLARETKETGDAQLALAGDTARRQLRAYPGVTGATIVIDAGKIRVAVEVENFSTTPAYKFRHAINHEITAGSAGSVEKTAFKDMQWDMAPHTKTTLRSTGDISESEIQGLIMPDHLGFIFWGRVEYEDAFEKPRHIEFAYRSGAFHRDVAWAVMPSTGMKVPREIYICNEPEPISYESN